MDRNSIIGFVLITVILIVWVFLSTPKPSDQIEQQTKQVAIDTNKPKPEPIKIIEQEPVVNTDSARTSNFGNWFKNKDQGNSDLITIESDHFIAQLSKKGGSLVSWQLKNFKTWNGYPVQLIHNELGSELNLLLTTTDAKLINTKNIYFNANFKNGDHIVLKDTVSYDIEFVLPFKNGGSKIIRKYSFKNGKYSFLTSVVFEKMEGIISSPEYQLMWENHLNLTEHNSVDESSSAYAYAMYGDEMIELDGSSFEETKSMKRDGLTKWVSSKNKYFAQAIIPKNIFGRGFLLEGRSYHLDNSGVQKKYLSGIKMPFDEKAREENNFEIYLGPNEYDILKSYDIGLQKILSLGLEWLIRPIAEYLMLPLFKLIHMVISNWGLVIVVFTFIIRLLLHPLNKSQLKSMQKMQALQPMINEVREKHKDDPQKMNAKMMGLYRDYGINPAGGCLPLLLQMPILYALWSVFRSAIELRQASFVWWIQDLSIPDTLFTIPFKLPIFGMDQFSGLALLMGITMFIQQKMTTKDPRQKAMIYMMPILFTLMFNSFPSGLNLYYFLFNLFSISQQFYMTKIKKQQIVLEKVPPDKRKGFFAKIADAQKMQQSRSKKK
jgi:YidC/Oxa1 family membrane protein insertase